MTFTDDDLKRLKDRIKSYVKWDVRDGPLDAEGYALLVARLEDAEVCVEDYESLVWHDKTKVEAWRKAAGK